MIRAIPEPPHIPVHDELEATIKQLIARKDAAVEGSVEYRMVIRQLKDLRDSCELAGPIMEDYGYWGGD